MHVYKVEVDQRSLGYYEAESKNAARVAALKHVTVERLESSDVIKVMNQRTPIISAATGECINAPDEPTTAAEDESQCGLFNGEPDAPDNAEDPNRELGG